MKYNDLLDKLDKQIDTLSTLMEAFDDDRRSVEWKTFAVLRGRSIQLRHRIELAREIDPFKRRIPEHW